MSVSFLSQRVKSLAPSATLAANDKAKQLAASGVDVINLTAGEPDFNTPDFIKKAAYQAITDNKTTYTAVDGIPELKQAIIHKLERDNALSYKPNQIIASCGVKQALFNITQATLNPGDEAIIPAPYWVSYPSMVQLAGAQSVFIETDIAHEFKITPDQLTAAITPKTKMLFLNSPSNPTGSIYTKDELVALGEVLLKHPQILIISDDIYEYVIWDECGFHNIVNACPALYDRTVVMNGVSKAHCMTGWRIGFAACAPDLMTAMKKIQSQSTSCATSIAQHAAATALNASKSDFFQPMLKAYQDRANWLVEALNGLPGIQCLPSKGTFYAFVDTSELIKQRGMKDDFELNAHLLEQAHVATTPGSAFGCPNHLRLSFATEMDTLRAAVDRIQSSLL